MNCARHSSLIFISSTEIHETSKKHTEQNKITKIKIIVTTKNKCNKKYKYNNKDNNNGNNNNKADSNKNIQKILIKNNRKNSRTINSQMFVIKDFLFVRI